MKEFRATSDQARLDLFIKSNVGAAEAIDRLLWIADQEQLPGDRLNPSPIGFGGIICSEKQQDLGLEWIGILELIDKVMREPVLQLGPYALVAKNEITRLDQEIEEIEAPSLLLQVLIGVHRCLQLLVEQWRKIGVACGDECIEIRLRLVTAAQHFITGQRSESYPLCSLPLPALRAGEVTQRCFESVIVTAAHRFELRVLFDKSRISARLRVR